MLLIIVSTICRNSFERVLLEGVQVQRTTHESNIYWEGVGSHNLFICQIYGITNDNDINKIYSSRKLYSCITCGDVNGYSRISNPVF